MEMLKEWGEVGEWPVELWRNDEATHSAQQKSRRRTLMHETSFQEAKVGAMDANAFAERYGAIYRDLYRYALCVMGNVADAEDAVGESVLAAYKARDNLKSEQSFRSWVFQITANECRRRLRARTEVVAIVPDEPDRSDGDLDRADAICVREALAALPEEDRTVVALAVVGGYSSTEIGIMLTMSPSAVRSRKKRSLAKLSVMLKDVTA